MSDIAVKVERIEDIEHKLRSLSEGEREAAYEAAKLRVAGVPVEEREYPPVKLPEPEPSEYPQWVLVGVVVLCIVVLIAAFIPSAYRMYVAGEKVFCNAFGEFTQDEPVEDWICASVGISTVLMAEIGQTVALLAIAVLGTSVVDDASYQKTTRTSNRIFWGVALMTTLVAYIGNLHVAQPWNHAAEFYGLFPWILDLFPPTLVIGIMYALKELVLYLIRRQYTYKMQVRIAYQKRDEQIESDRHERSRYLMEPETHPQWLRTYSLALKEALMTANGRQKGERSDSKSVQARLDLLRSLSSAEWKHLIKLQMVQADFTVDPTKMSPVEYLRTKLDEQLPPPPSSAITEEDVKQASDGVWQAEDGTWSYRSELSKHERHGLESREDALKKLKQYEYHYRRRLASE